MSKFGPRRPILGADGTQRIRIWGKSGSCIGEMFVRSKVRPLDEDIAFVRRYLEVFNRQQKTTTGETTKIMTTKNEVVLIGKIEKLKTKDDSFFALINVGLEKWIPVTAHVKDDKQRAGLLVDLAKFRIGDEIVLKGYVRPWSVEKDGKWTNSLDIRILDLKPGTIPDRKPQEGGSVDNSTPAGW